MDRHLEKLVHMNTALILAYFFPPIQASGSIRPMGFCRYLVENDWKPVVLSTIGSSIYPPFQVENNEDESTEFEVYRVADNNWLPHLIRTKNNFKKYASSVLSAAKFIGSYKEDKSGSADQNTVQAISSRKRLVEEYLFSFPDYQCFWISRCLKHAAQIIHKHKPKVIFATGSPWSSLVLANRLGTQFKIPYILDFRDPWTQGNPYINYQHQILVKRSQKIERKVCTQAAAIIANTDELAEQFRIAYPEIAANITAITNGFDAGLFGGLPEKVYANSSIALRKKCIEVVHLGSIYGKRSPLALLKAFRTLLENGSITSDCIKFRFIGAWDVHEQECSRHVDFLIRMGVLSLEPSMPRAACLEIMKNADSLLIIQPDSPLQIPGKLFEYIAAERPFFVVGGEGATANLVNKYELGHVYSNDVVALQDMIHTIATADFDHMKPENAAREPFNYKNLSKKLVDVFNSVITC